MTVGHCLRDHGTETKNSFDSVTRSLKYIEKDYHRSLDLDETLDWTWTGLGLDFRHYFAKLIFN